MDPRTDETWFAMELTLKYASPWCVVVCLFVLFKLIEN